MPTSFETGGEVLTVGSMVVLFDGNRQKECAITAIGPKRVTIESPYGHKPIPFSRETRQALQGGYTLYFRTKTELAAEQRRTLAKSRLRDLGVEARLAGPGKDGLDGYSTDTLIRIAEMLEEEKLNPSTIKAS